MRSPLSSSSSSDDEDDDGVYTADEIRVDDSSVHDSPHPPGGAPTASSSFSLPRSRPHLFTPATTASSSARRPPEVSRTKSDDTPPPSRFASFFRPSPPTSPPTSAPSSPSSPPSLSSGMEVIKLDRHGGMKRKRLFFQVTPATPTNPPTRPHHVGLRPS